MGLRSIMPMRVKRRTGASTGSVIYVILRSVGPTRVLRTPSYWSEVLQLLEITSTEC